MSTGDDKLEEPNIPGTSKKNPVPPWSLPFYRSEQILPLLVFFNDGDEQLPGDWLKLAWSSVTEKSCQVYS